MGKAADRERVMVDNPANADGIYYREYLATDEELAPYVNLYAKIIVPAGVTMNFHMHLEDQEIYYFVQGHGHYNDNGTIVPFQAGDTFFCPKGQGHCVINDGDEEVQFIALITQC